MRLLNPVDLTMIVVLGNGITTSSAKCCNRTATNLLEIPVHGQAEQTPLIPVTKLPKTFDWSNVNGYNYLVSNWNQHIPTYCGSCYAHGTLASVQDRIKIFKGGRAPDIMLARQSFLNCGPAHGYGSGCGGGNPNDIFGFMHDVGLPDETCNNYVAETTTSCDSMAICMNCMVKDDGSKNCWAVEKHTRYYVKEWGPVHDGEEAMMSEIYTRGPIVCGFVSDEEFDFRYSGGVHRVSAGKDEEDINHDVEVTGWGVTEEGVKFWQARNSWGSYWGELGFFKIERGVDLNSFESECFFAIPDSQEEEEVSGGLLTGGMYGLVEKSEVASAEGIGFLRDLHATDWSDFEIPSTLQDAGVALFVTPEGEPGSDKIENQGVEERNRMEGFSRFHTLIVGAIGGAMLCCAVFFVASVRIAHRGYTGIEEEGGNMGGVH